ncbi:PadR family transcriptional regulator [Brevibacillus fluminis]|uniref:PadR family transcriptional regulator n=1 Tax=Brevibacillus fluminis TaxID=511487 RepID=A0A3M8DQ93_9BACL|nr:PadR family transcriptional regulator [Brevibacillus fluminis]RNB90283.1 PadR family transcriptional regulator [Brevibacillus fluminis]
MSAIRYVLLTLLVREPLSGYDIKQQMNSRIGPFWKVGSNQIYPTLSKLRADGYVKLQGVKLHEYRPARKLYEITEQGREALKQWTVESGGLGTIRDELLLKAYNLWLVDPAKMIVRVEEIKKQHEGILADYLAKVEELKPLRDSRLKMDPISSSVAVVEFGIQYEKLYIDWCNRLLAGMGDD